jgi:lipoprotein-anchoring transpeptidase ErfK/SrfK
VVSKGVDPIWRKPDWAYAESGEPIPPPEDPSRLVKGELGEFFLDLGDGYLIHGTRNEALLGRPASHGCVRLGAADLRRLYEAAAPGTRVFIYE